MSKLLRLISFALILLNSVAVTSTVSAGLGQGDVQFKDRNSLEN